MTQHKPSQWDEYRAAFEADAGPLGFDLTRRESICGEPWTEYAEEVTGQRFGGFIAGAALSSQGAGEAAQPARVVEPPTGAIINGRTLAERLELQYGFECEDGPLNLCSDWQQFRQCFEYLASHFDLPAAPTLLNGLTQAETDASASVAGLTAAPTPSQAGAVTELEVQLSKVLRGASGVADLAVIANRYVDEWKDWDEQRKKALAAFEAKKAGGV